MARRPLVISRRESWGTVAYDTRDHRFSYREREPLCSDPYASLPVALNVVVTRHCNMDCDYCVARDFDGIEEGDLVLTQKMIHWINQSRFMLLVLTGGEPLMPPYDSVSFKIIESVQRQGVVLDTNGTFRPSQEALARLRRNRVMVRVSLDSLNPSEESAKRHVSGGSRMDDESAHRDKLTNIARFLDSGVNTAIQTVVWRKNPRPLYQLADWLSEQGIRQWYLQRLIPSHRMKSPGVRSALAREEYYNVADDVAAKAASVGVECVPKMDLRHNSVFLLMTNGILYTQGEKPGQKVRIGTIEERIDYFAHVSAADHACRYYLAQTRHALARAGQRRKS
jgi:MoaA/NifB/PqqE/SkfB family radical SAM enzyme